MPSMIVYVSPMTSIAIVRLSIRRTEGVRLTLNFSNFPSTSLRMRIVIILLIRVGFIENSRFLRSIGIKITRKRTIRVEILLILLIRFSILRIVRAENRVENICSRKRTIIRTIHRLPISKISSQQPVKSRTAPTILS